MIKHIKRTERCRSKEVQMRHFRLMDSCRIVASADIRKCPSSGRLPAEQSQERRGTQGFFQVFLHWMSESRKTKRIYFEYLWVWILVWMKFLKSWHRHYSYPKNHVGPKIMASTDSEAPSHWPSAVKSRLFDLGIHRSVGHTQGEKKITMDITMTSPWNHH